VGVEVDINIFLGVSRGGINRRGLDIVVIGVEVVVVVVEVVVGVT
jgi:hypothetical protein